MNASLPARTHGLPHVLRPGDTFVSLVNRGSTLRPGPAYWTDHTVEVVPEGHLGYVTYATHDRPGRVDISPTVH